MKSNYTNSFLIALLLLIGYSYTLNAQSLAAGGWHSLIVCQDGTVKAFGENATGQLGDGTTTDRSTPVTVPGLTDIIAVSAGGDQLEAHSMALKNDGTVWAWGSNLYGGLGNGNTTNSNAPVKALVLTGVTAISAGGWHSAALKNDGTVWAWGWNTDGQLGDGSTTDKAVPAQVPGLSGVTKIAAGTYHVLALKDDGTVWAWGDNISGQIGDGTTDDRSTPTKVNGLSGVVSIAAGRFFSLAVKSDGTVWTWGENLYGQLGNGNTNDSPVPVQVSGLNGITSAVAATGAFHCMAVKNDNTVWAWGRNTYGNLGDGTVDHRSAPVQMTGVNNITGLAAGTNFSLLMKNDGTMWGCGRNASGQLGDGTVLQRNTVAQATGLCPLKPLEVKESESAFLQVLVFPNPSANGKFILDIRKSNSQFESAAASKIEIFNPIAQKVFESDFDFQMLNQNVKIDISAEPNGIYFMNIRSGEQTNTYKLIKQ